MAPSQQSTTRAAIRIIGLLVLLFLFLPFVVFFWLLGIQRIRARFAQWFYIGVRRMLNIRLTVEGAPSRERPLMIVSNHSSYLDVFVIGSQLPLSFTPKREVRRWPVIGFLCVLADCVFVERRPSHMEEARDEMVKRIQEGRVLCLFPEGTTSDGKHLKPFKSGFLSLAEENGLPVQPASIAYTHIGKQPIDDSMRELVAWVGEATFFAHFFRFLRLPGIAVTVQWHTPLALSNFADRKELTKAAESQVTQGLHRLLENAR